MGLRPVYALDSFSGIGALGLAVKRVLPGCRVVAYLENEATSIARLVARMEDGTLDSAPVWSDVATFDAGNFNRRLVAATGKGIDLVYGGFPCTDISNAGKGAGIHAERSGLFFDLMAAVRDLRPRYLFLENVAALTVRGLDAVLGALAEVGFAARWGCLRASDVGAPHGRDRWWCLAWDREQLADDHRRGRGLGADGAVIEADGRGAAREPAGSDGELADAIGGRHDGRAPEPWGRPLGGVAAAGHGAAGDTAVVHAERQRGLVPLAGGLAGAADAGTAEQRVDGTGDALADTSRGRLGVNGPVPEAPGRGASSRTPGAGGEGADGIPQWPPGPADSRQWASVLARWPHLAPATVGAVRRVVDGDAVGDDLCLCHRGDRLRGLGNAVVPQCAEAALRLLWWDAFGERL